MLPVLLQDSDPLVVSVIRDDSSSVHPGAVVVLHPPALPLLRGEARLALIHPGEAEGGRPGGGHEDEHESVHVCRSRGCVVSSTAVIWRRGASCCRWRNTYTCSGLDFQNKSFLLLLVQTLDVE